MSMMVNASDDALQQTLLGEVLSKIEQVESRPKNPVALSTPDLV